MPATLHFAALAPLCIAFTAAALSATPSDAAPTQPASAKADIRAVPFAAVTFSDAFWAPKQNVCRERTIPHSWQYVTREIEDNEIAAGWKSLPRGDDTPWNQANLHKVLETCAYALAQGPDPELDKKLDGIIAAIAAAQQPNGYVNALITVRHKTPWTNLDGQHEGYVAGHMIEAAVAHYEATGKVSFLAVASKMADHIYNHFVIEGNPGVCGHAELELALARLYRVTGEKRYLELAQNWIERRGKPGPHSSDTARSYFMDHLPIRQVPEVTGHAVRTMFYLTGAADVAVETGDKSLADAVRRLWADTTQRKMYVTGSVGSQEKDEGFGPAYDLPNAGGYSESCATGGLIYFADAMFRLDGDAASVDVLERTLYNALLHGISLDGTTTYYRNPLTDENHVRDNCWVCCPPCISRTLLRVQDYAYARSSSGIYVNLYAAGTATVPVAKQTVKLTQETRYPWEGKVALTMQPVKPVRLALRLRVPGWCRKATVAVNGAVIARPKLEKGYAVIEREWRPGDRVELDFALPIERMEAHPNVKQDSGLVALQRGPIVYGFEGLDNDGNVDITLPTDPQLGVEHRNDFLGGVDVITAKTADGRTVRAIPFYALANRDKSKQVVWVRQTGKTESVTGWEGRLYRPWR